MACLSNINPKTWFIAFIRRVMPYVIPSIALVSRHRPNKHNMWKPNVCDGVYLGGVAQIIGYYETKDLLWDA